jgi:hypothetical protein
VAEQTSEPAWRSWDGGDFILPLFLFLPAAGIASIYGGRAETLHIPGAEIAQCAHFFMVASSFVVPMMLSVGRVARSRHAVTMGISFLCLAFPALLLNFGSIGIPLSRTMSHEEVMTLQETFGIPTLHTDDSREGKRLLLRRSDFTESVSAYLASIGVVVPRKNVTPSPISKPNKL